MKKHLIICGLLFCIGCKHTEPTIEPASVLAGTYVSSDFVTFDKKIPFPINGKSITMKITRVAADTVDIRVSAPANELYSPARDTTYRKVYILTKPQGYYLTLEADNTLPGNQLGSELMIAPPLLRLLHRTGYPMFLSRQTTSWAVYQSGFRKRIKMFQYGDTG